MIKIVTVCVWKMPLESAPVSRAGCEVFVVLSIQRESRASAPKDETDTPRSNKIHLSCKRGMLEKY